MKTDLSIDEMGFKEGGKVTLLTRQGNPIGLSTATRVTKCTVTTVVGAFAQSPDKNIYPMGSNPRIEIVSGKYGLVDRLRPYAIGDEVLIEQARRHVKHHAERLELITAIKDFAVSLAIVKLSRPDSIAAIESIAVKLSLKGMVRPYLVCQRVATLSDRYFDHLPIAVIKEVLSTIGTVFNNESEVKS